MGLLEEGKLLPVMEEFYSLQGEGFHTGKAAYFVRIGGCDVGCRWCDVKESWNPTLFQPVPADDVVSRASACPAGAVVVTGGEPLSYNLNYLTRKLRKLDLRTFLETSGSQPLSGIWNWICVSPKKGNPPLLEIISMASELKVIIHDQSDFLWAAEQAILVSPRCHLYLQPEWSRQKIMMPEVIRFIKDHPQWRISIQSHKYMNIP